MFKGSFVALLTPFKQGRIDEQALEHLINWQIDQGTNGFVIGGSTGEGLLLTFDEHQLLIQIATTIVAGRVPVIAGVATFSAVNAIEHCLQAQAKGADAVMIVTPPYLKPSQPALQQFYTNIHDQIDLPIIIYNNPGRTGGILVQDDTLCQLAALPRIVGVKDSTDNLSRPAHLRQRLGPNFSLLSGDDPTTPAFLAQGGDGAISVIANIAPKLCADLHKAWRVSDLPLFNVLQSQLTSLNKILTFDANPVPIKYAASKLNLCYNELRLPLLPLAIQSCAHVDTVLKQLN